ncbi:MAG: hypothetical protein IKF52_00385 [Clostridia bacterium]|nr:hypothetical protein [Clostridia bacterium]
MAKLFIDEIKYLKSRVETRYGGQHNMNGANTFYADGDYHVDGLPAQVILVLSDENGRKYQYDIREQILEYYGKKRISQKMVKQFKEEVDSGHVKLSVFHGVVILS